MTGWRGPMLGLARLAAVAVLAASCSGDPAGEPAATTVIPATTAAPADSTTSVVTSASSSSTTPPSTTTDSTATTTPVTTTTPAGTTTTTLPAWWREITADAPLRVWVIGDSLSGRVGSALARLGGGFGVVLAAREYEPGTGLVTPAFFDWPGFVTEQLPQVAPDVVVCVLGANDGQALYSGGGPIEFATPAWDARYAALVGDFMDQLAAGARRVYWVGVPVMEGPNYDQRVRHINGILRFEAGLRLDVRYIDGYALFEAAGGGYAAELPDATGALVTVRAPDGIHLTDAGGERVARRILEVLQADWRLAGG